MQVRIWDPVAPEPYSLDSLAHKPLGGTEASVIRVANGLRGLGHDVQIVFEPPTEGDACIVLRDPLALNQVSMPSVLWMHDYLTAGDITPEHRAVARGKPIVAVSDFHRLNVEKYLGAAKRIYNPVDVGVNYCDTKQPYAVILSSPCKGLESSLEVFAAMQKRWKLVILNPGYEPSPQIDTKRVRTLGPRTHTEAMRVLASASLLIHANRKFPETFGLVYAEARVLGVPVLTCDHGAVREVLGDCPGIMPVDAPTDKMARMGDRLMGQSTPPCPGIFQPETAALEWQTLLVQATTPNH